MIIDPSKTTKAKLIAMLKDKEVLEVPSALKGMTFGCMMFIEKCLQYLVNIKSANNVAWKAAKQLIDVSWDSEGNVSLTFRAGTHGIVPPNYQNHVESDPCDGCPGPDEAVCNDGLKCLGMLEG